MMNAEASPCIEPASLACSARSWFWSPSRANSGPHGIMVDAGGLVWFTEMNTNRMAVFDPSTERFRELPIPTTGSGPHTPIVDGNGLWFSVVPPTSGPWFTEQSGNKIGYVDP